MLERDLLQWVIAVAERTGWRAWHVPAPMVADRRTSAWRPYRGAAGLPDLVLLCAEPPRMILAELKGDGGKLSAAQEEFLRMAQAVAEASQVEVARPLGFEWHRPIGVYVWTPADRDEIMRVLMTKALP